MSVDVHLYTKAFSVGDIGGTRVELDLSKNGAIKSGYNWSEDNRTKAWIDFHLFGNMSYMFQSLVSKDLFYNRSGMALLRRQY